MRAFVAISVIGYVLGAAVIVWELYRLARSDASPVSETYAATAPTALTLAAVLAPRRLERAALVALFGVAFAAAFAAPANESTESLARQTVALAGAVAGVIAFAPLALRMRRERPSARVVVQELSTTLALASAAVVAAVPTLNALHRATATHTSFSYLLGRPLSDLFRQLGWWGGIVVLLLFAATRAPSPLRVGLLIGSAPPIFMLGALSGVMFDYIGPWVALGSFLLLPAGLLGLASSQRRMAGLGLGIAFGVLATLALLMVTFGPRRG